MFLPAIAEKLKKEKEQSIEKRLELPKYNEEYSEKQEEKQTKQTVIHIQII